MRLEELNAIQNSIKELELANDELSGRIEAFKGKVHSRLLELLTIYNNYYSVKDFNNSLTVTQYSITEHKIYFRVLGSALNEMAFKFPIAALWDDEIIVKKAIARKRNEEGQLLALLHAKEKEVSSIRKRLKAAGILKEEE